MTGFAQSMIDAMARVARREIRDARMATAGWGTVTSATPLAVVLDEGSGAPMTATPAPLVAGLATGDRVWVEIAGNRAVIVGRAGGGADPSRSTALRFGTWNIYYASAPDHAWSGRRGPLAQTVIDSGVRVLAVQESDYIGTSSEQAVQLAASLNAASGSTGQWRSQSYGSRCAVLYDAAVWEWTGEGGKEPSAWPEREMVWLLLRHRETGVRVIAASDHWEAWNAATRLTQATATNAALVRLQRRYGVDAVMGADTNDYGATLGVPTAAMRGNDFLDLRSAFPAARRSEWPTWHDWKPNPPWTAEGQAQNEWLDQIFVPVGAQVAEGGIYDTTLPLTSALSSDHHLITATITVRDQGYDDGGDDTGWLDHGSTLDAGWRSSTASPLQYRVISGVCYWRGVAERTSGTVATGYVVTALPSQARPAGSGAPLNFAFDTGAGTVSGGVYPDEGGSLYIWASGTLPSFRIGGSYPIG